MESRIKRKNLIWICVITVVVMVWGYQVWQMNQSIPQTKESVEDGKQWNSWKDGLEIKIDGMEFMEDSEIRGEFADDENFYKEEVKLLWVQIQVRNRDRQEKKVDLLDIGAETSGWCNIPDPQFYYKLGDEQKEISFMLNPDETVSYKLPFLLLRANFRDKEWEKMEEKEYYITLKLYPEKKKILINKK